MSSKDEILTAIRQNTVQRYEYPDWEIKATVYPDKISRFCEISQFVGGKAVVLQEAEDINDIIRSHFPEARKIASQMEEITCATIRPDTLAEGTGRYRRGGRRRSVRRSGKRCGLDSSERKTQSTLFHC